MYRMDHDHVDVEADNEEDATMMMYDTHGDWEWDSTEEID